MQFFHKSLITAVALTSGLMAAPFHRITLPKEHVALHNNQILIQLDGEWVSVEDLRSDGKRLYGPRIRDPLMSRCTRIDLELDFDKNVLRLGAQFDPLEREKRDRREHYDNQQNSESSNPPEPSHHTERDQDN